MGTVIVTKDLPVTGQRRHAVLCDQHDYHSAWLQIASNAESLKRAHEVLHHGKPRHRDSVLMAKRMGW